jgi:hypothetical protein
MRNYSVKIYARKVLNHITGKICLLDKSMDGAVLVAEVSAEKYPERKLRYAVSGIIYKNVNQLQTKVYTKTNSST